MIRADNYNFNADYYKLYNQNEKYNKKSESLQKDISQEDILTISEEGKRSFEQANQNGNYATEQVDFIQNENIELDTKSVKCSGKIAVNAGKISRKIAAAKTKEQLRAVIAEIRSDFKQVKSGLETGMCDQTELTKVNSLMAMAQGRLGNVENRQATPEEENNFLISSLM